MTGAPFSECKTALTAALSGTASAGQSDADTLAQAVEWLRKKGVATATALSGKGRASGQGLIAIAVPTHDAAAMIEVWRAQHTCLFDMTFASNATPLQLTSETDFVARNELFMELCRGIARTAVPTGSTASSSSTSSTGFADATNDELEALKTSPLAGSSTPIGQAVLELVGKIRETMILKRAASIRLPGGVIAPYLHNSVGPGLGSIGVLVGIKSKQHLPESAIPIAQDLAKKLAMHVAAAKPKYLTKDHVPSDALAKEREVLKAQTEGTGKSEAITARIVEGKLAKFFGESVLLEQNFVLAEKDTKVSALVNAASKQAGVPLEVAGWLHFSIGALEK
jgi:elongation factor Ts